MTAPDRTDKRLLRVIENGLPLAARPYKAVADALGLGENEVIRRLARMVETGVVKRLGAVIHHHELGYRANAMVVWDVPDDRVSAVGARMAAFPFVTLCYRRPRRLPDWRYNLFCMIHGKDRDTVMRQIAEVNDKLDLSEEPRAVLFSVRRFKQRGATFAPAAAPAGRQREVA